MRLIESSSIAKRGDLALNEDSIFYSEAWAAVIDGCSSAQRLPTVEHSSGVVARTLIGQTLQSLDPLATKEQAFGALNGAIARWYEEQGLYEFCSENPAMRASAYIALASRRWREVWILGDCQALIDGRIHTHHKAVDTLMENLRAFFIEHLLATGYSEDDLIADPLLVDRQLRPIMALQPTLQNRGSSSYAYAVLDGFFTDLDAIITVKLGAEATEVVLATDGYPYLEPTLAKSEERLAHLLADDPLLYRSWRSTKGLVAPSLSFDDRSYLRFIV